MQINEFDDQLPFVSVVLPVRNESVYIEKALSSVLAQDYPTDRMEVIIADGMSDDGTQKIIEETAKKYPDRPCSLLNNSGKIVSTGLNAAIRAAKGDVIVRVDGHAVIANDYIRRCVDALRQNNAECVGGRIESVGIGYVGEAIALAMSSSFGVGASKFRMNHLDGPVIPTDTVPFGAFRKDVFERVGLFNERMVRHQDYEFNYRLRKSGGSIFLLPSARATYYVRPTLGKLWKQYWQYGVWKGYFLRNHADSIRFRHLIPSLFILSVIFSTLIALVFPGGAFVVPVILVVYCLYILLAGFYIAAKKHIKYALILPVVLATIHISYGSGICLGVLTGLEEKK